jgi:UDPglucose--hexose-1-phosphate uridylyltransferase
LHHLTSQEIASFAQAISRLTIKYDNLFSTSFAYSMGIHQRPTPSQNPAVLDEDDIAHLHLHFNPPLLRSATVRKFLVGYVQSSNALAEFLTPCIKRFELMGEPQRDLTAEQATKRLRECGEMHYLDSDV